MSSTVVRDCTPPSGPGDNALVIVMGEDGSLSVDADILHNILTMGDNTTSVNVVRLSGTDPETETVDVTLDTFFENDVSSSQTVFNSDITMEAEINDYSISDDVNVITRMCQNVHMDHCYTPHTSPSQKHESVSTSSDSVEPSTSKLKSANSQDFNSSTEDLVAVLSAFDSSTENDTNKCLQQKVTPKNNISMPVPLKSTTSHSIDTKLSVGVNKLKTLNKGVMPTQTFNKKTSIPLSKKSLKIVTVSKPATSLKSISQNLQNQPVESIKDFFNEDQLNCSNIKAVQNNNKELFGFKETVSKDDLSDISSDPDYFDDDSADSDFETLHRKPLTKTKQLKKPIVKRGSKITSFRDKQVIKSRVPRSKINKNLNNKRTSALKTKVIFPNEKESKSKVESDKKNLVTLIKNEPSLTPNISEVQTEAGKLSLDTAKKIVKKKVQKPVEIFDDGIALFSTPDVIRRVSTNSKSGEILKSSDDKINESPNKQMVKVTRSLSLDQKSRELSEQNISKLLPGNEMLDREEVLSHRIDAPNGESMNTELSNSNKLILDQNINVTDNTSTGIIDQNDQNLSNLNYDSANLDLDLNTEELIPEDLLYQVAKLVENADIQKVIDTNLTFVEQNLAELDQEMNKNTDDDSFSVKEIMTGENLATPSTKDLQKIIGGDLSNVSIVTNMSSVAQLQSRNERLSGTNIQNDQKELTVSQVGIITKNNTNKPLQIVRSDGRIITIPPIEKPATRSSKKKQEDSDTNFVQSTLSLIQDQKIIKKSTYIGNENIKGLSTEDPIFRQEEHFTVDDADMSDSDESWKSEDDPDRLWCICKQPHNNRFMICCDTCEEWFHGQCVGISKALGRQMEQEGKEWQCPNCQKVKKHALQAALNEAQADMPLSPSREVNQEGENISKRRCIVCKAPSRSESVYCSEKCIVQHSNTVERVVVFERATGKCLSGNNAPTVANLKQWLKEHPGFEVVSSGNKTFTQTKLSFPKIDKSNLPVKSISNISSHKHKVDKKQLLSGQGFEQKPLTQLAFYGKQSVLQTPGGKTYITKPQTIVKQVPKQVQILPKTTKLIQPHSLPVKQAAIKPKPTPNNTTSLSISPHTIKSQQQPTQIKPNITPQKIARQKSVSERTSVSSASSTNDTKSPVATKAPEQLRENVRKTLAEQINIRLKEESELTMTEDEVKKLTTVIESELYSLFNKDTGTKYRSRYRSLVFNIKDTKNTTLWRRIVGKSISPKELVRLTPEELASSELAQWREREAKHQLEMIKKSELDLLNCARTYVLKSHKGEEVIEKRAEVDSTIVAELDGSINEDSRMPSGEIISERSLSQINTLKDIMQGKDDKDRHRRGSSTSSSTKRNRNNKDEKDREKSKESRGKHREGNRERDRKKRSRSHSKERRNDGSKDKKESKRSRRRSRSGSRAKSTERESRRHKDKHRDHNRHKSSSSRHKSNHKDSGSDSTTSKSSHDKVFCDVGKGTTGTTGELDKKSKETLERLMDNKIVAPLEDRLWKHVQEHDLPATTCDSESDHEPSSTVMIATPPHSGEQEDKNLMDKFSESIVKGDCASSPVDSVSTATQSMKSLPIPHLTSADGPNVWEGYINMVDVAKFYITAQEVSGDCTGLSNELPSGLDIVGRISPDTVWDYLSKMRRSTAKHISILRLTAANVEEHMPYHALYTYLSSRKRFGVVKTTDTSIKDFYIMPQASYNPLPQVLLPLNGPGFEESRPHLLLGIIVSSKRKKAFQQTLSETNTVAKKVKESPPRSYTPPPTAGNKDPRLLRQQMSTVSIMPPLPQVGQSLTSLDLPKPPSHDDDMDEPYSPEDSDDGAPNSTILSAPPKSINSSNSKDISSYIPSAPAISYTAEQKQIVTDLSTFEPFKATNFSSIPGLDTSSTPTTGTGSLGVSSFLNTLSASTSSGIVSTEALLSTQIVSANLSTMLGTDDFLNSATFDNGISSIDKSDLQKKMDELNQQIEKQKQEIQNISQGIVGKEDLGSSCLANIALPSNLQQILDSIKTSNSSQSLLDSSQESNDLAKTLGHSLSIPPPTIIPNIISTNTSVEEYCPQTSKNNPKTASYVPSTSLVQTDNSSNDKVQSVLPTIPLILPKLNTRTETTLKNRSEINLTIPLNLPRPKRSFSAISDGKSDSALQSIPLNLPKIKKCNSPKTELDANIKKGDKPKNDNLSKQSGSVLSTLSEEDLIRKAAEMLGTKPEENESSLETSPVTPKQTDSVLSSLSEEDLIRKAAEMLGETVNESETDMKKEEDDEPYDPGESQPVSIKQGPVLYTPGQIKKAKFPEVDQPPIPGMEDYEEEI